jgi:conjugal transfer/entry exclusion protein
MNQETVYAELDLTCIMKTTVILVSFIQRKGAYIQDSHVLSLLDPANFAQKHLLIIRT